MSYLYPIFGHRNVDKTRFNEYIYPIGTYIDELSSIIIINITIIILSI